ncbi:hypothetical protein TPAR_03158 [Tolypocladium paradoxum]|uniref:Uncharacterized protein n=1 Tax=Tolypocladium paradoxum TaxID=94208 RepID=A0A2S4L2K4_9HYPO|nr:hypothetical protein TPAR_03158 [Tolypocladium paradoxum]
MLLSGAPALTTRAGPREAFYTLEMRCATPVCVRCISTRPTLQATSTCGVCLKLASPLVLCNEAYNHYLKTSRCRASRPNSDAATASTCIYARVPARRCVAREVGR